MTTADHAPSKGFLNRLGLHRPELRAWAIYDWANSAFMTTVLQVFPIFFVKTAAADIAPEVARARFAFFTSAAVILVGLIGPLLGAVADQKGNKKGFLAAFLAIGVVATGSMALVQRGDVLLAALIFIVGNIGATSTLAFYNSLLPTIAKPEEIDRVSTAGFALGYLGGGVLLALNLAMISKPALFGLADAGVATRLAFVSVAVWWALFSIPLFRKVPEPSSVRAQQSLPLGIALKAAFAQLASTLRDLRTRYRDAGVLLLAFLLYNDAVNTIIRMATTFGDEIGIPEPSLYAAILMVQFVGMPFAFLFGAISDRIGPKRAIYIGLFVYVLITIVGYHLRTTAQFFLIGLMVATSQGGIQALSRSLFASLIPKSKAGEMFGFFGVFDRFGGALGAIVFGLVLSATGSSRPAIFALIVFFIVGGLVLARVDVARGSAAASEEDRLAESA